MTIEYKTRISVVLPEGNFDSPEDAKSKARAYIRIAKEQYPDAEITVEVAERQSGGSKTIVERLESGQWIEDETAAEYLNGLVENEWD